ncbi:MAG: response regulator transcription factor [Magnetococcales bacterium]|nr:response regulator transcription factor [Magnetococcales bacterium]
MRNQPVLLMVEDDLSLQAVMSAYLEQAGFTVLTAATAARFHALLAQAEPDLILLDLELPDEDGLVLARQVRARSQVPIIMVTGRTDSGDRVTGLEFGANDYVVKPFDPRELTLRIRNLLHLTSGGRWPQATAARERFVFAGLTLDCGTRRLLDAQGADIHLTHSEFELLRILVTRTGRVQSRESLLDALARTPEGSSDRAVDVLVSRLRKKLRKHGLTDQVILTVPGVGYRLAVPVEG